MTAAEPWPGERPRRHGRGPSPSRSGVAGHGRAGGAAAGRDRLGARDGADRARRSRRAGRYLQRRPGDDPHLGDCGRAAAGGIGAARRGQGLPARPARVARMAYRGAGIGRDVRLRCRRDPVDGRGRQRDRDETGHRFDRDRHPDRPLRHGRRVTGRRRRRDRRRCSARDRPGPQHGRCRPEHRDDPAHRRRGGGAARRGGVRAGARRRSSGPPSCSTTRHAARAAPR